LFGLILKFILLFLILFGLAQFLSYRLKIKSEFLPVTVLTGVGVIMFLAGLLNMMPEAVTLLTLFSFGSVGYIFLRERSLKNIFSPGLFFFLLGAAYLAYFLRGLQLEYYDDFSHWGLIVKEMLLTDRLPNFSSKMITFQAYPPGTAVVLYFTGKILGNTESVMLFGQGLFYLSCITPLFALIRKKQYLSWLLIVPATLYFLTGNLGVVALSVDTLLSLLGLAGTAILVYLYREKRIEEAILPLALITSYLNIVKNSGILFVFILVGIYFVMIQKGTVQKKKAAVGGMAIVGIPVLFKFLWDKHVKLVFADGASTKHAMSVENYRNILGEKSLGDVKQITFDLLRSSVNINSPEIKVLVVALVAVAVIGTLKRMNHFTGIGESDSDSSRIEKGLLLFMVGIYAAYQVGLWATYIFSMPLAEAIVLASYNRYNITCIMYLLGVVLIYFLCEMERMDTKPVVLKTAMVGISLAVMVSPLYWMNDSVKNLFVKKDYSAHYKTHLHNIIQANQLTDESAYIIYVGDYIGESSQDYLYYITCYELQTRAVNVVTPDTVDLLGEFTSPVKFIVLRDDEKVKNKLKQYGIFEYGVDEVVQIN
jgi:hypothetical protein